MYELVIRIKDVERCVLREEDPRIVELERQRHVRSLTEGEAIVREVSDEESK